MVITRDPELEAALTEVARDKGVAPEVLALNVLRERIISMAELLPRDEWERGLRALATDCGVSLSNEALSREELYD
ncbi:MAG TPA: hypothetical protein VMG10_07880 [Gemmataceae bacterium]|nr:hypothetical protein [Gemmataceae bacterium]